MIATLGCAAAWAIDPPTALPEPDLQIATTISPPDERLSPDDPRRALLRLEARAGLSQADDKALIEEMMARYERMGHTVTKLQQQLAAAPNAERPPPAVPVTPTQSLDGLAGDRTWLLLAGGIVALTLFGMRWHNLHRQAASDSLDEPSRWHHDADGAPLSMTMPPPTLSPANREVRPEPPAERVSTGQGKTIAIADQATVSPADNRQTGTAAGPTTQASRMKAPNSGDVATDAELALELAEIMLSLRLTDGAAHALEDHIRSHPRQSLVHSLKLLGIYQRSGQQANFEASALQLQEHFNITPPNWASADQPAVWSAHIPSLEQYAHISRRIQELWPQRSCAEYLMRLLEDNRGGTRIGFPKPVVEEILLLLALLRA